jgi:hypothetical protein
MAKRSTTRRRQLVAVPALAIVGLTFVAGCGSAKGASASLARMSKLPIITVPPPYCRAIGVGQDRGSDSGITGRNARITAVFACDLRPIGAQGPGVAFPQALVDYYQRTYPQFRFSDPDGNIQLIGGSGTTVVSVAFRRDHPDVDTYTRITLAKTTRAETAFISVSAEDNKG